MQCNLAKKLSPKLKDPRSFFIPYLITNMNIIQALCDLEARVNLMPLSICQKVNIRELKQTTIYLQLTDKSMKYPIGILENISLKVGKFIIIVDFVILEMEEDVQIPIILGTPFLATARAIIDVKNRRLTLKVGEEEVEFNVFHAMKQKSDIDKCLKFNIIDELVEEEFNKRYPEDPLEACIARSCTTKDENKEITVCQ
ncbi:uncharacterized protein LOC131177834 [Hevea brasiliensis]|uniref:uncharacterized protein LOC131177834 n=1 Tax=Hevea brasiliensis TaxID=3981 RepID=UPI0025D771ED|nr:uncharacterized protein LOC131177834 [Hevea brasiliensis]